jgi:hypothetical protein
VGLEKGFQILKTAIHKPIKPGVRGFREDGVKIAIIAKASAKGYVEIEGNFHKSGLTKTTEGPIAKHHLPLDGGDPEGAPGA